MTFKIIDLFAGPGGLGEGFTALDGGGTFDIAVSAEMEASAHSTLILRSFFRLAQGAGDEQALRAYYHYCNTGRGTHPTSSSAALWKTAQREARQLTLGDKAANEILDSAISEANLQSDSTVLIGGPPCQAYSLVGRARNRGKEHYVAEDDHRHFLYREYLRIVAKVTPAVFVMENVKGILSSKVGGKRVFSDILRDLANPLKATVGQTGARYKIYSLALPTYFEDEMDPDEVDAHDFVIKAEEFGIPQARHRVILLGVRNDLAPKEHPLLSRSTQIDVRRAIGALPKLRSKLSKNDGPEAWQNVVTQFGNELAAAAKNTHDFAINLKRNAANISTDLSTGALRYIAPMDSNRSDLYGEWILDPEIKVWLNHETRSHMSSDLRRYFFSAVFTDHYGMSPKGHNDFNLPGLAPAHANWKSGKFADRFRVQAFDAPSATVTSHIAKDGHYFIHPDATQCRSLTVREAARLQTFPDNYFFQGSRTQQYHQVGNAVPPLLAHQMAKLVKGLLC